MYGTQITTITERASKHQPNAFQLNILLQQTVNERAKLMLVCHSQTLLLVGPYQYKRPSPQNVHMNCHRKYLPHPKLLFRFHCTR